MNAAKNHLRVLIFKALLGLFLLFVSVRTYAQSSWGKTNSPEMGRYEDIFFLDQNLGFAVSGSGYILKTEDGGLHWTQKYFKNSQYIRSIEFSSAKRGFAGSLYSNSEILLMKTLDGGESWTDISSVFNYTVRGVCGICSVDTNVTYAVGSWGSPAFVIKTTDGGITWNQIDMSTYAFGLVDVNFIDENTGYVAGASNVASEGAVILKTTDGGSTWSKVYVSNQSGDYVWKIQNLNGANWFGSIQRGAIHGATKIIRSDDGGNSWIDKTVALTAHRSQMIGFLNPNKGWTGEVQLFETNDGGNTWTTYPDGFNAYNRFFRINESQAYLSGRFVYKLGGIPIGIAETEADKESFLSIRITPNPQKNPIEISLVSDQITPYRFYIFDASGRTTLFNGNGILKSGVNVIRDIPLLAAGVYYFSVMVNAGVKSEKFIIE